MMKLLTQPESFFPNLYEQSLFLQLLRLVFQWRGQKAEEKRLEKRVEQLEQGQKLLLVVTLVLLVITLSRGRLMS